MSRPERGLPGQEVERDDHWALPHPVYPAAFNLADHLERQAASGARVGLPEPVRPTRAPGRS
ncbi:hypothetical protein ABT346_17030 [Micromonospora peucetia]|uniref:hypothetical protein n=1 Tax=Micromonospora peucetia TaxID=47871 RepID=UPI00332D472A